ncbi:MAG: hypothetical protein BTN85_1123 [Candidatus Methanohalarchaeum thermophilum]|uniref:Uncharacterized protein n=1 Tax=Methanohalarchaeum thermophilum TaxID=1903181 RepID=A0A1Q6DWA3_METT1|nr:MAG: hypothetical protein BTN85_1123 [Candidatus Methanohalarchaeum thermophilum]
MIDKNRAVFLSPSLGPKHIIEMDIAEVLESNVSPWNLQGVANRVHLEDHLIAGHKTPYTGSMNRWKHLPKSLI